MGLRIKTNIGSINAQRQLNNTTLQLRDTMTKLASGSRINKASDDAAGLAVSENLRADIRSLNMAARNANDGISLVQTAEGGLSQTANMLIRLRELSIQAASDTIGDREREFLDKEFLQLKDEIDRIANITSFNGTRLLIGDTQLPDDMNQRPNSFPLEVQVSKDYYAESDAITERNPVNTIKIDFSRINAFADGEGSLNLGRAEEGTRVNNKAAAQNSIQVIDHAIFKVNDYRAYLGGVQNRLGTAIENLGTWTENLTESNSRIRDTEFAEETANLTKQNILQQAGTSVLASANTSPQIALSLIKGI